MTRRIVWLATSLLGLYLAQSASAQTINNTADCTSQGPWTCSVPANQTAPYSFTAGAANAATIGGSMVGTNSHSITITGSTLPSAATDATTGNAYGLNFNSDGTLGTNGNTGSNSSKNGTNGGNSGFLTVTNTGPISITLSGGQVAPVTGGLFVNYGGYGGSATQSGGFGGFGGNAAGGANVTNSGAISLTSTSLNGSFLGGVTGLGVLLQGGDGGAGYSTSDNGLNSGGGVGGGSTQGALVVTNSGSIGIGSSSFDASGNGRVFGLSAMALPGAPGNATQTPNPFGTASSYPPNSATPNCANAAAQALPNCLGHGNGHLGQGGPTNPNGDGGPGAAISVTNTAPIGIYWNDRGETTSVAGIYARSEGGTGLVLNSPSVPPPNSGGNGGSAGAVTVTTSAPITISAANLNGGASGAALTAISRGGNGGISWESSWPGGNGGAAGAVSVTATGNLAAAGTGLAGVLALSHGGSGGDGQTDASLSIHNADGGVGGNAGAVAVNLGVSGNTTVATSVSTTGGNAFGIAALSQGGAGGNGSDFDEAAGTTHGSNGGNGGTAGNVTVTVGTGSSIATAGTNAAAVVAQSAGGAGGAAGLCQTTLACSAGSGGSPGPGGTVQVSNAASITTGGAGAYGILGQSAGGAGGAGGTASGLIYAGGGSGGSGGAGGAVTLGNSGSVTTSGASAAAMVAQSIGGGGGAAGAGINSIAGLGGSDSVTAINNGGTVTVNNSGTLITSGGGNTAPPPPPVGTTSGQFATIFDAAFASASPGIMAQSIGGGGGAGGGSTGLVSIGGSGQSGGTGGSVTLSNTGTIGTTGQQASAIIAQSIGGGGGSGGSALSVVAAVPVAVAIGGSGGVGGNGGSATISNNGGQIATSGSNAIGILSQSVGGGGGSGGGGYSYDVGEGLAVAVAVGGSGGQGGAGGTASVEVSNASISTGNNTVSTGTGITPTQGNTLPADAFAVVSQSIGGGGGTGGAATSEALAIAVPIPAGEETAAVAASVVVGVGGTGGSGGGGGTARATLNQGTALVTSGQGSHAVEVQSIGGGGGNGGDSSALSATTGYGQAGNNAKITALTLNVAVGVGGNGGGTGDGGSASATIGPYTPVAGAPVAVTTYGDFANGVLVQSIGGGGGNAGFGSTTTANYGNSVNTSVNVGVGGIGAAGGNGGTAAGTLNQGSSIQTYGSGANGLVVQSIGGGGGTSQGVMLSLGVTAEAEEALPKTNGTLELGGKLFMNIGQQGAAGGSGGSATVTSNGSIQTSGGQAIGILVQSIGGGGGEAGSAGTDASADNPVNTVVRARKAVLNVIQGQVSGDLGFGISLGGSGGNAGTGGTTTVNLGSASRIATSGDWAAGVVAQSIGGGGGLGGTAGEGDNFSAGRFGISFGYTLGAGPHFDANYNVEGKQGAGGNGGPVTLNLAGGNAISTTGFGAFGILGQSIGGGGGTAEEGSASATGSLSVGQQADGTGATVGDAGAVLISSGSSSSVTTAGQGAHGIVLQSIGGGGGLAMAGNSTSTGSGSYALRVGGGTNSTSSNVNGAGGPVTADALLAVNTTGTTAYGLLAQSIGGGGGIAAAPSAAATQGSTTLGGLSQAAESWNGSASPCSGSVPNCGGPVTVTLQPGSQIATSGGGSHAVFAQSVGGGGGIAQYPDGKLGLAIATSAGGSAPKGFGAAVAVTTNGNITTTGAGAYGVFAQSVGGGGGLADNGSVTYAGSTGSNTSSSATGGGSVTVTQNGTIAATGQNAIGIFAQSSSPSGNNGAVSVTVNGGVTGGGGTGHASTNIQGFGIYANGGNSSNFVFITPTGSVSAVSGNAIGYSGSGTISVNNSGTLSGSVWLTNNSGTKGNLYNFGTYNAAGATIDANLSDAPGSTTNFDPPLTFQNTLITGTYTQAAGARALFAFDFDALQADTLTVVGAASLAGQIQVVPRIILPNRSIPFITFDGPVSLQGIGVAGSKLFGYTLAQSGNTLTITNTSADFAPASFGLARYQREVASGLQSLWSAGGTSAFGQLFATLETAAEANPSSYAGQLSQLSPSASGAIAVRLGADAQAFSNAMLSCPEFQSGTALLREGRCAWARLIGRTTSAGTSDGGVGFTVKSATYQIGGQIEVAPDWYVVGSFAYQTSWMDGAGNATQGRGQTGFLGGGVKWDSGPWLVAATVSGSHGTFKTSRYIGIAGFTGAATATPSADSIGGRLRFAYSWFTDEWYVRPNVNLDLIYARVPGYTEAGLSPVTLGYAAASQTIFVGTPGIEVGRRFDITDVGTLRAYGGLGVSFLSNADWKIRTGFTGALPGAGTFTTTVPAGSVVGRVTGGVQLLTASGIDLRAQYDGEYGGNITSHAGLLTFGWHF